MDAPGFLVMAKMCATCIYRPDTLFDLERLEEEVRDPYGGYSGYRICHEAADACCRGFWEAHKDEFNSGRVAQRLGMVVFVPLELAKKRKMLDA